MLAALREVVPLSDDDVARFNALRRSKHSYQGIPLRLKLSEEEIARFAVNRWAFPGVDVVPYLTRAYPLGDEFAHVVGYVGRIDENDLTRLDKGEYAGTTHVGKTGIERFYEDRLHGEPGYEQVEVNADHRPIGACSSRAYPKPGANLYLTIDAHLQQAAEAAFEGRAGAAIVVDPRNGEVLAMVSVPSFDPNPFVNGIASADYAVLLNDPDKPLLEPRAARRLHAGLDDEAVHGARRARARPAQTRGHRAFGRRVPSFRASRAAIATTSAAATAASIWCRRSRNRSTRISIRSPTTWASIGCRRSWPNSASASRPASISSAKAPACCRRRNGSARRFNQPFYPGETVIAGIGQGYWVVTPLQLVQAVGDHRRRGVPHPLHLLRARAVGHRQQAPS